MSKCYLYLRTSADDRGEKWASRCSGRTAPLRCLSWHGGERQGSRPRSMLGSTPFYARRMSGFTLDYLRI